MLDAVATPEPEMSAVHDAAAAAAAAAEEAVGLAAAAAKAAAAAEGAMGDAEPGSEAKPAGRRTRGVSLSPALHSASAQNTLARRPVPRCPSPDEEGARAPAGGVCVPHPSIRLRHALAGCAAQLSLVVHCAGQRLFPWISTAAEAWGCRHQRRARHGALGQPIPPGGAPIRLTPPHTARDLPAPLPSPWRASPCLRADLASRP